MMEQLQPCQDQPKGSEEESSTEAQEAVQDQRNRMLEEHACRQLVGGSESLLRWQLTAELKLGSTSL